MAGDGGRVTLDVFSDVACPWCFVGLRMIQRAQEGWDGPQIDVRWRAFQLAPDNPPRGRPFREVIEDKLGGPAGYAQMSARLAAIGAEKYLDELDFAARQAGAGAPAHPAADTAS